MGSVQFRVLGPLQVLRDGGEPVPLCGDRQRRALAVLLLVANRTVEPPQLIDAVWDERPPATAKRQIQNCLSALRRELDLAAAEATILGDGTGYRIRVGPGRLDAEVFGELDQRARALAAAGDTERAVEAFRAALRLWRGPALAGLTGRVIQAGAARLDEQRLAALEDCVGLELRLGRCHELVGELIEAVTIHPLRERLVGALMTALYRTGRQAEALREYRALRGRLADELGVDPSTELQRLHTAFLRNEADTGSGGQAHRPGADQGGGRMAGDGARVAGDGAAIAGVAGDGAGRRNQLPRDVGDFTGRRREEAELLAALTVGACGGTVAAISGKAGVGKTALAVHVAHRLGGEFPGGQLFLNLGGMGGRPVSADEALLRVLLQLGAERADIPRRPEARAEMYRTSLAARRVLVVLDNVADEAQVRPLLPAGTGSAALITSRRPLAGLEAAHRLSLSELDREESIELLERLVGPARVAGEREATDRIVQLCGQLPLAIRIAGAKLAVKAHWSVAELVERLAGEQCRLDELQVGDLAVRGSFALSHRALDPPTRDVFDALGLLHAADFPAWVPATLLGRPVAEAREALERLVDVQLLDVARRDPAGRHRYQLHDLLAVFARERLRDTEAVAAKRVGLGRAVHAWLAVVDSMEARLAGGAGPAGSEPAAAEPAVSGARRPAAPYPLGWLPSQLAALRGAAPDSPDAVWEVGWASTATLVAISFELWSHWDDWRMTRDAALLAGHRVGDRLAPGPRPGEYRVVPGRLHPWSEVVTELEAGEATFAELGEWRWQAATAVSLGNLYRAQGRYALASATLRRGLDLFRDLDHPGWEAAALFSLGSLHVVDGCLTEAVARYEDCMAIFRRLGDPLWQAHTQRALGYAYQQHGQNAPAAAVLGRCHPVLRERDDPMWHGHTLLFLARAELGLGRYGDARAHLHACLADFRRRGDVRSEAMALRVLAAVTGRRAPAEAIVLLDDCLQLFRRLADPVGVAYTLGDLAEQHRAVGRLDRSASLDRSSRALLHDLGLRIPAEL